MLPSDLCDRAGDELLEHRYVEIAQLLEIQTRLAHLVLANLGQQGLLSVSFRRQVHHQLAAADSKTGHGSLPGASALVGVAVRAIADDAWPPHLWRMLCDLLEQSHQLMAVGALLLAGSGKDV